jgi:hypothetical protein
LQVLTSRRAMALRLEEERLEKSLAKEAAKQMR